MDRKKLSSLEKHFTLRTGTDSNGRGRWVQFYAPGLHSRRLMLFQVDVDDIFDKDGNRFEDDLSS